MIIDTHVHGRGDKEWSYKSTIPMTLELAEAQGVDIIFDMPNQPRPVTGRRRVIERLNQVPPEKFEMYRLFVGLTDNPLQIAEAVDCWNEFWQVIGLKLFAGESIGPLAVVLPERQRLIYQVLTDLGYEGVVANHCGLKSEMRPDLWDWRNPISHCHARPKSAETRGAEIILQAAVDAGFKGTVHICHVSCPETVNVVNRFRTEGQIKVSCEVTPHHILFSEEQMLGPNGIIFKMNPPLRSESDRCGLIAQLWRGKIDCIGTDHAPHSLVEKLADPYLSGFPSLILYRDFVELYLPEELGMSRELIEAMTCGNILRIFGDKLADVA